MEYERDRRLLQALWYDHRAPIHRRKDSSEAEDKEPMKSSAIVSRESIAASIILDQPGRHLRQRREQLRSCFSTVALDTAPYCTHRLLS